MHKNTFRTASILIIVMMLVLCLFGCEDNNTDTTGVSDGATNVATTVAGMDSDSNIESSTAEKSVVSVDATTAPVQDLDVVYSNDSVSLKAEYAPVKAYDESGAEVDVLSVYGSSYASYGGALCFYSDGTFDTFIGAYGNADNESGTFTAVSDTELEMSFYNGDVVTATVTNSLDGVATEIRMMHRSFDVVFSCE